MKDRKLEENIKRTRDFIDIWHKFRDIFENTVSEGHIDKEREKEFLSTRLLVSSRYEDLMDSLGVKPLERFIMSPHVYNVLSLERLSVMSDEKRKAIDQDWEESSDFLRSLCERLERKKRRIEGFNKFFFVAKKKIRRMT